MRSLLVLGIGMCLIACQKTHSPLSSSSTNSAHYSIPTPPSSTMMEQSSSSLEVSSSSSANAKSKAQLLKLKKELIKELEAAFSGDERCTEPWFQAQGWTMMTVRNLSGPHSENMLVFSSYLRNGQEFIDDNENLTAVSVSDELGDYRSHGDGYEWLWVFEKKQNHWKYIDGISGLDQLELQVVDANGDRRPDLVWSAYWGNGSGAHSYEIRTYQNARHKVLYRKTVPPHPDAPAEYRDAYIGKCLEIEIRPLDPPLLVEKTLARKEVKNNKGLDTIFEIQTRNLVLRGNRFSKLKSAKIEQVKNLDCGYWRD